MKVLETKKESVVLELTIIDIENMITAERSSWLSSMTTADEYEKQGDDVMYEAWERIADRHHKRLKQLQDIKSNI